ncbi:hypothetical protein M422DRAFT_53292 [Sphaerobolus stellatus SS14]|uniref:Unplaced genomic scaffold SPHSTscaffold_163, whole genome shotgun sequence n=1 Tax=Sphaerobolus stellatus (strain SS14) TaxID=990650 RepID=A0A0C9TNW3_SPHS4|nr:hypothetical protein M422DRAFT_53292 [Sphaerobolus stellatus SS14]
MPWFQQAYLPLPTEGNDSFHQKEKKVDDSEINRRCQCGIGTALILSLALNILLVFSWSSTGMNHARMSPPEPVSLIARSYDAPFITDYVSPPAEAVEDLNVKFHRVLKDDVPLYEEIPSTASDEAWEAPWNGKRP